MKKSRLIVFACLSVVFLQQVSTDDVEFADVYAADDEADTDADADTNAAPWDSDANLETEYLTTLVRAMGQVAKDPALRADYQRRVDEANQREYIFGPPTFNCNVTVTKAPATSVHDLGPSDVNVLAAMGDSVTAGFGVGAENVIAVFDQNRGESWSIGAQRSLDAGVTTLATLVKKFNPDVKGYSLCKSGRLSKHAWMNVAMGGATNRNMPSQAREVVDKCAEDPTIDFENDWKVVTLFVGGNDLCASCFNDNYNASMYVKRIGEALDIFHTELPRAFINIVPMFDITPLRNYSDGIFCEFFQPFACRCGILDEFRPDARPMQLAYYEGLKGLIDGGAYDTREDFTVVIQPMFVDLVPPIDPDTGFYDKTFLSHDCFHPSLKAHQAFAYALWNTMLIPFGEKPTEWDPYEPDPTFYCPTEENPYFGTRRNAPALKKKAGNVKSENDVHKL